MRIVFPVSLLASVLASCQLPVLDVQARYGRPEISGTAGFASGGTGGSADLEQAGLDDDEAISARADLDFGAPILVALAQAPRFEGSGTLDVSVSDGTNTIAGGASVNTVAELGLYDLALLFDLVPGDTFELAVGFGAAFLDTELSFEEPGSGTRVESQEQVPVPLVAAQLAVWIGPVELALFAGGMDYTYEDDSVTYLDADAYARWRLLGGEKSLRASLVAGYRLTDLDLEYDDDGTEIEADLEIRGPYVGLELSL